MPWTAAQFKSKHLGGMASSDQARRGAGAANGALRVCLKSGGSRKFCEARAIRIGKSAARKKVKGKGQEMGLAEKDARRKVFGKVQEAVWSTRYKNSLPDSHFLHVRPGGTKKGGFTTPRDLRDFPYKDKDGKVDLPHLRNAIARIPQAKGLSPALKRRLQARARRLLGRK